MWATMADAHREWHTNTGTPIGTPGCPQDACHPPEPGCWDCFDTDPECPTCLAALAALADLPDPEPRPWPWDNPPPF